MKSYSEAAEKNDLDISKRITHLGLMAFGILAWLTSGWAGDHEHAKHLGFKVHILFTAWTGGRWPSALH